MKKNFSLSEDFLSYLLIYAKDGPVKAKIDLNDKIIAIVITYDSTVGSYTISYEEPDMIVNFC